MVNPYYSKGSSFSKEERKAFELHGLLPPNKQTLEEQVSRAYEQYKSRPDDLAKNTFLASMKAQNQVLFYKVIPLSNITLEKWPLLADIYSAHTNASEGNVQCDLYAHRSGRHRELLAAVQETRRLFSEHQGSG